MALGNLVRLHDISSVICGVHPDVCGASSVVQAVTDKEGWYSSQSWPLIKESTISQRVANHDEEMSMQVQNLLQPWADHDSELLMMLLLLNWRKQTQLLQK